MNIIQIALRLSAVLDGISAERKRRIKKADAMIYLAARECARQYETRNPGIHLECDYVNPIADVD